MTENGEKKALILSGIMWNDTKQRHQTIAEIFAEEGYEVYFVEGIVSSSFSVKKLISRLRNRKNNKTGTQPELTVPKKIHVTGGGYVNPDGGLFKLVNFRRNKKIIGEIGNRFDVVIDYLPINTTADFLDRIKYKLLIFDCVRDFCNWGGYPKSLPKIEGRLCEKSDYIFTDSFYLTDKMKKKYGDKVVQLLPTVGDEISDGSYIKKSGKIKKIGYIGSLGTHIDTDLLAKLSSEGYEIHLFGRAETELDLKIVDHGFFTDLYQMMNEVKASADALIIPYKGNMDGVIPAKTIQCLSTGLPVFVSDFYDSRRLGEYLYVYRNAEELGNLLTNFDYDDFYKRRDKIDKFVKENTVKNLKGRIERIINDKNE